MIHEICGGCRIAANAAGVALSAEQTTCPACIYEGVSTGDITLRLTKLGENHQPPAGWEHKVIAATELPSITAEIRAALAEVTGGVWRHPVKTRYGQVVSDVAPWHDGYGGHLIAESCPPQVGRYLVAVQPNHMTALLASYEQTIDQAARAKLRIAELEAKVQRMAAHIDAIETGGEGRATTTATSTRAAAYNGCMGCAKCQPWGFADHREKEIEVTNTINELRDIADRAILRANSLDIQLRQANRREAEILAARVKLEQELATVSARADRDARVAASTIGKMQLEIGGHESRAKNLNEMIDSRDRRIEELSRICRELKNESASLSGQVAMAESRLRQNQANFANELQAAVCRQNAAHESINVDARSAARARAAVESSATGRDGVPDLDASIREMRGLAAQAEGRIEDLENQVADLADTAASQAAEIRALVAAIRRDEDEIQRLRPYELAAGRAKTRDFTKDEG